MIPLSLGRGVDPTHPHLAPSLKKELHTPLCVLSWHTIGRTLHSPFTPVSFTVTNRQRVFTPGLLLHRENFTLYFPENGTIFRNISCRFLRHKRCHCPCTHHEGTTWRWEAAFTPRPLLTRANSPWREYGHLHLFHLYPQVLPSLQTYFSFM
jgi:hypothetical protein